MSGCFTEDKNAIGYLARTDAKLDAITRMNWFYLSYPGSNLASKFGLMVIIPKPVVSLIYSLLIASWPMDIKKDMPI